MRKKWTKEETNILENIYSNSDRKYIEDLLPNREWGAICTKALKMGLYRETNDWNKNDEDLLKNVYSNTTIEELLKIFKGRSVASIHIKASRLRLKKNNNIESNLINDIEWDDDE